MILCFKLMLTKGFLLTLQKLVEEPFFKFAAWGPEYKWRPFPSRNELLKWSPRFTRLYQPQLYISRPPEFVLWPLQRSPAIISADATIVEAVIVVEEDGILMNILAKADMGTGLNSQCSALTS